MISIRQMHYLLSATLIVQRKRRERNNMAWFVCILYALSIFNPAICETKINDEYPNIQDLFPVIPLPEGRRSPLDTPSFNIDIEKIDIDKFKKKSEMLMNTLLRNVTMEESRRQKLPLQSMAEYWKASIHQLKTKSLDLMLQVIYMARHRVKQLEKEKFFSKTDTGYRIAFLYRRLRRMWRKLMEIHTLMKNKLLDRKWKVEHMMVLHLKAIKIHTDYLYLWWVLITVDGKYTKTSRMSRAGQTTTMSAVINGDGEEPVTIVQK